MEDFEKSILQEVAAMNKTLSEFSNTMTAFEGRVEKALLEMGGKVKGNQELLSKELNSYVQKEICETHRANNGLRFSNLEQRVAINEREIEIHLKDVDRTKDDNSKRITAWLPDVVKFIALVGGFIYLVIR